VIGAVLPGCNATVTRRVRSVSEKSKETALMTIHRPAAPFTDHPELAYVPGSMIGEFPFAQHTR
jgi:hypothetical protein